MSGDRFLEPLEWHTYPDDGRSCLVSPGQGAIDYNLILSGRPADLDEVIGLAGVPELSEKPADSIMLGELAGQKQLEHVPALKAFEDICI